MTPDHAIAQQWASQLHAKTLGGVVAAIRSYASNSRMLRHSGISLAAYCETAARDVDVSEIDRKLPPELIKQLEDAQPDYGPVLDNRDPLVQSA